MSHHDRRPSRSRGEGRRSSSSNPIYSTVPSMVPRNIRTPQQIPIGPRSLLEPTPEMVYNTVKVAMRKAKKEELQRQYMEYKARAASYSEASKKSQEVVEEKDSSSSDEDFTERIKRFERKQQEQKQQPTKTVGSFQLAALSTALNSEQSETGAKVSEGSSKASDFKPQVVLQSNSKIFEWRSTSDPNQAVPKAERFLIQPTASQANATFVSSFVSLPAATEAAENSNSSNKTVSMEEAVISDLPEKETPSLVHANPVVSISSPSIATPQTPNSNSQESRKICFGLSRLKPALAYDPLEKTGREGGNRSESESETETSSSEDENVVEEYALEDCTKVTKTKTRLRFQISEKVLESEDQAMTHKIFSKWFDFNWKNYDTGAVPVHLGRVPKETQFTAFEKSQFLQEIRSKMPDIDLMRDYFYMMRAVNDSYIASPDNFERFDTDNGPCMRMKASVKRTIPFVAFMKMLNNHLYSYEELDFWLLKLHWRLLETNRFLESAVREPLYNNNNNNKQTPDIVDMPTQNGSASRVASESKPKPINGHATKRFKPSASDDSNITPEPEDEPEMSSVSEGPGDDSMDGGEFSVDIPPGTSSKDSEEENSSSAPAFASLYDGLEAPKIYQIDDRLPPIPVLCSRDPKSSNPVSEEQFFLDKLYNQEYYYSTKEFRIDVVPPPARPIMFLLESLKERRLPNGKDVPVGQQVLFVLPRGYNDIC